MSNKKGPACSVRTSREEVVTEGEDQANPALVDETGSGRLSRVITRERGGGIGWWFSFPSCKNFLASKKRLKCINTKREEMT